MSSLRFAGSALALSLLLTACADQTPVDPADSRDDAVPAFDYLNGPMNPGESPVWRLEEIGYLQITDPAQSLRVRMYDALDIYVCGGSSDLPLWATQNVEGDRVRHLSKIQEVPLVVYPWPNDPNKPFCDFLAEDWLFKGTGTAHANDNNVFWYLGTGGNNTYRVHVNGIVEDAAGNPYRLAGMSHNTVKGMCCFYGYDANGDPYYIDPADQSYERMSVIQTISIHPIQ